MSHHTLGVSSLALVVAGLAACGGDPFGPSDGPVVSRVLASRSFTCALGEDSAALCWGGNEVGQLGDGSISDLLAPQRVSGDLKFVELSTKASGRHVCGLVFSGEAYCWGENNFGQLGNGSFDYRVSPQPVSGDLRFTSISAGWRFTCALTHAADAYCWGRGEFGQLGDGLATRSLTPVAVAGGHKFAKIAVGSNNLVCGLTTEERILCWGLDIRGALGSPSSEMCTRSDGLQLACATRPQPISSDERFRDLSSGSAFACAITLSDTALCWGQNEEGQLGSESAELCGQGSLSEMPCARLPTPVSGGHRFAMVATGITHGCGVTTDGDTYCWGENTFGQRGDGLIGTSSSVPGLVLGGLTFKAVSAGDNHSCGETADGLRYCWGANDRGQLGTGDRNIALSPVAVVDAVEAR